jgi:hypothetical protein
VNPTLQWWLGLLLIAMGCAGGLWLAFSAARARRRDEEDLRNIRDWMRREHTDVH